MLVPVAFALLTVALLMSCSPPGPDSLTSGVWRGHSRGEEFLFQINGPDQQLSGVVHVLRAGRKESELPITAGNFDGTRVEMRIDATGVNVEGNVDLAAGLLPIAISADSGFETVMDLEWHPADEYPNLRPLGRTDPERPWTYSLPDNDTQGWETAIPEDVGLDRADIEELYRAVADGQAGVLHSLLIARQGKLVAEEYFHGYEREDLHQLLSVSKSVSSLLVGIAKGQGHITSLEQPLVEILPIFSRGAAPGWEEIHLEHVLTMSMGLDWNDEEAEFTHTTGEAAFRAVFKRQPVQVPGSRWRYVNQDVNLLAAVIRQATRSHAGDFAREALFAPLDIAHFDWSVHETDGYPLMDGSLRMRPLDMAKLGQLILDGGRWNGRQVVSEQWIQQSTGPRIDRDDLPGGYGYLWWRGEVKGTGQPRSVIFANGWGSQFVAVFPEDDLLVACTGGNQDNGKHFKIVELLERLLRTPS